MPVRCCIYRRDQLKIGNPYCAYSRGLSLKTTQSVHDSSTYWTTQIVPLIFCLFYIKLALSNTYDFSKLYISNYISQVFVDRKNILFVSFFCLFGGLSETFYFILSWKLLIYVLVVSYLQSKVVLSVFQFSLHHSLFL